MPLPPEFHVAEADGILRIEWDNRQVAKDYSGGLVVTWLLLGFFMEVWLYLFLVRVISGPYDFFQSGDLLAVPVMILFAWLIFRSIPRMLLARTWRERIEVSREAVTHSKFGPFAPVTKVYPVS